MRLSDFQRNFSKLVSSKNIHVDEVNGWLKQCRSDGALSPLEGINIYRDNIFFGHLKAITNSFPRTEMAIGKENLNLLITDFLSRNSCQKEDLLELAEMFFAYLQREQNVSPQTITCAALDLAWEKAFYAPSDMPLTWAALSLVSASLDHIHLKLRTSATVLEDASSFAGILPDERHKGCLVWRDDNFVRRIESIEDNLLPTLKLFYDGKSLSTAAQCFTATELGECLLVLVERKWLSAL